MRRASDGMSSFGEMSHSQRLRAKIELVGRGLDQAAGAFWSHPCLRELYPELLFMNHSLIRASVPLMEAAVTSARARPSTDPVAACVTDYLSTHIPEELHHDDWLLDDLEALGIRREEVMRRMPSPTVAALVGAPYYWLFHVHPVSLLGYIAVLEGQPPTVPFLEEVVARTGLPADAFRTYFKHARLDPRHRDDLDQALDRMPLTADQTALLGVSAIGTVHGLALAFEGVVNSQVRRGDPATVSA